MTFHTTNIRWLAIGIDDGFIDDPDETIEFSTTDDTPYLAWSIDLLPGVIYSVTLQGNVRSADGTVKAVFMHNFTVFQDAGAPTTEGVLGGVRHIAPDVTTTSPAPALSVDYDTSHAFLYATGLVATGLDWALTLTVTPK